MLDLLRVFFNSRYVKREAQGSAKYVTVEGRKGFDREKFRDSLRSAWLQVAAITFANNNGLEGLPDWGIDADFSLFEIRDRGEEIIEGGNLLDLFDFKIIKELFEVALGETINAESIDIKIEGLQVEGQEVNVVQIAGGDSSSGQDNAVATGEITIVFTGSEGEVTTIQIDTGELAALLAAQAAYQLLVELTKALEPAVAGEDVLELEGFTASQLAALSPEARELLTTYNGNILSNDSRDARTSGLKVVSVLNEKENVGREVDVAYFDENDQFAGSYGKVTINENGSWTFKLNTENEVIAQLDAGESLPIFVPYAISDGLLREETIETEVIETFEVVLKPPKVSFSLSGGLSLSFGEKILTVSQVKVIQETFLVETPPNFSTLTININGVNDAPEGVEDNLDIFESSFDSPLFYFVNSTVNVIANDTDPDQNDILNNKLAITKFRYDANGDGQFGDGETLALEEYLPGSSFTGPLGVTFSLAEDGTFTVTTNAAVVNHLDSTPDPNHPDFGDLDSAYMKQFQHQIEIEYLLNDGSVNAQDLEGNDVYTKATITLRGSNDAPVAQVDSLNIDEAISFDADNRVNLLTGQAKNIGAQDYFNGYYVVKQIGGEFTGGRDTDVDTNDMFTGNDVTTGNLKIYSVFDSEGNERFFGEEFQGMPQDTDFIDVDTGVGIARVFRNGEMEFNPFNKLAEGQQQTGSIQYRLTDEVTGDIPGENHESAPTTVNFTVIGENSAPELQNDVVVLSEEDVLTTALLDNDSDPEGDTIFFNNISIDGTKYFSGQTANFEYGSISIASPGMLTFTPSDQLDDGETHEIRFTYEVTDIFGLKSAAEYVATIVGQNDAPVTTADTITFNEDLTDNVELNILANDTDVDTSDSLRTQNISNVSIGNLGSISIVPNGDAIFTPNTEGLQYLAEGETLSETHTYLITDETEVVEGTINVTVTGVNDAPITVDDEAALGEDDADVGFNVLANDYDVDTTDTISIVPVNNAAVGSIGTITINAAGDAVFTANNAALQYLDEDESVTETFTYQTSDGRTTSDGTISITVHGQNDAPVAVDDALTVNEGAVGNGDLFDNDTELDDSDRPNLEVNRIRYEGQNHFFGGNDSITLNTNIGEVVINKDGTYAFTPSGESLALNDTLSDTFQYRVTDGDIRDTANATFTVRGTNANPVGVDDAATVHENDVDVTDLIVNDTDVDNGAVLSFRGITIDGNEYLGGTGGNVSTSLGIVNVSSAGEITFTPSDQLDDNETDTLTLTYTVQDEHGAVGTADYVATIIGENDAPIALDDALSVDEGATGSGNVITNDTEVDINDQPDLALDRIRYNGQNTFFGNDDSITINTSVGTVVINKDGTFDFTPVGDDLAVGDTESDTIQYRVTDGDERDTGDLVVTKVGVNQDPVAGDVAKSGSEDATITGNLITEGPATDVDGDTLNVSQFIVGTTTYNAGQTATFSHGTIKIESNGDYTVTPNDRLDAGEFFNLPVTFTVSDPFGAVDMASLDINIIGQEDAPTPQNDVIAFNEDDSDPIGIEILNNDTDPDDSDTLTAIEVTNEAVGNLGFITIAADGTTTFTPNNAALQYLAQNETHTENFTYQVTDGSITSTADIQVTVTGQNDTPTALTDDVSTDEDAASLDFNVLTNDIDPDTLDVLTVTPLTNVTVTDAAFGAIGTLSISSTGVASFVPNNAALQALDDGDSVSGSVTYQMTDSHETVSGTVNITVSGSNDAPTTNPDAAVFDEDDTATIHFNVLSNDSDVDKDDSVTVIPVVNVSLGNLGVINIDANGNATFLPAAGFQLLSGNPTSAIDYLSQGEQVTESYTYQATDGTDITHGVVSVTVTGENDAPVANSDFASVGEDDANVIFNVLANDTDIDQSDTLTVVPINNQAVGSIGFISILADGTATFTPSNASLQYLDDGDSVVEEVFYQVSDGITTTFGSIEIAVNGSNDEPVTNPDSIFLLEDSTGDIMVNLTDNDTDPEGDNVIAVPVVNQAVGTFGTITIDTDGEATFTPNNANFQYLAAGESASEIYTYFAHDGSGAPATGETVTITVSGQNDIASITGIDIGTNGFVTENNNASPVTLMGTVLVSDADTNDTHRINTLGVNAFTAYTLGAIVATAYGTVVVNDNGPNSSLTFVYTLDQQNDAILRLNTGETLVDSFTMSAHDGTGSTNNITMNITINGLTSALFNNGDNTVDFNTITTSDYIPGSDINHALDGNDVVTLANTEALMIASGYAYSSGQFGNITGTSAFYGGEGNDILTGSQYADTLFGEGGDDTLDGGVGNTGTFDSLNGGAGNDTFIVNRTGANIDGGADFDTVSFANADFINGSFTLAENGAGTATAWAYFSGFQYAQNIQNVENVIGSMGNDSITGNSSSNSLFGGAGNDILSGGIGSSSNYLDGGTGVDVLNGGLGDDTLVDIGAGASIDNLNGGGGNDIIQGGNDNVLNAANIGVRTNFSTGATLNTSGSFSTVQDSIDGGSGTDTFRGTDGDDSLAFSLNSYGTYRPYYFVNIERIEGLGGNDEIEMLNNNISQFQIDGGDGNDIIWGSESYTEVINGGAGNDIIWGGGGYDGWAGYGTNDTYTGGSGSDSFQFGSSSSTSSGSTIYVTDFNAAEDNLVFYDAYIYNNVSSPGSNGYTISGLQQGSDYHISFNNFSNTLTIVLQNQNFAQTNSLTDIQNLGINATVV